MVLCITSMPSTSNTLPDLPFLLSGGRGGHSADNFVARDEGKLHAKLLLTYNFVAAPAQSEGVQQCRDIAIPGTHPTSEYLHDYFASFGIFPIHGDLLQLAAFLLERVRRISAWVRHFAR